MIVSNMVMIVAQPKRTHITTKTALRSEFLFSQEGKDEVIIQHEACFAV